MKKADPSDRAKKVSLAISLVRANKDQFERQELSLLLKKAGCPYPLAVPTLLIKERLLEKQGNFYRFVRQEPIHFATLEAGMSEISNKMQQSVKNSPSKQKKSSSSDLEPNEEMKAVTFLKNLGYRLQKPVTEYHEC